MGERSERIRAGTARVAVVGQGYVGLTVAMAAVDAGFAVVGLETDPQRVAWLRRGTSYVEDVPDRVLAAALEAGYLPTDDPADLAGFDVAVISVPTPLHEGRPDLSMVEAATDAVADALEPGALIILESTTWPGTTEELVGPILTERTGLRPGRDFLLGYSPERIDPGNAAWTLRNTPKVVSAVDEPSLEAVDAFYSAFVDTLVTVSSPAVAELTKLLENTFRHVNIALVNELARFAAALDVDLREAIDAAASKPFGFMAFRPGPGVGGHCLPIDPTYLSWRVKRQLGESFRFVELANDINRHMPHYTVERVQALLNRAKLPVNGTPILVLGIAYKPDTSDAREAPGITVVEQLERLGADVTVVDPYVRDPVLPPDVVVSRELDADLLGDTELTVLITDHDDFDYDLIERGARRIFDTRGRLGRLDLGNVEHL